MKLWGLLLILCLSGFAQAQTEETCAQKVQSIGPAFIETLSTDYRPLMCSDNVLALKKTLDRFGLLPSNAHVVVLRHKAVPYIGITPLQARLTFNEQIYKAPTWMFHVFLVVDGWVLDMDYTDTPQAIGFSVYMNQMWNPDQLKDYVAQVMPLESYSSKDVYGTFSKEAILSVSELMTFFTKTTCFEEPAVVLPHGSI